MERDLKVIPNTIARGY